MGAFRRVEAGGVLIRVCRPEDAGRMYGIINDAAKVYEGHIPPDCYREPYMPMDELTKEMDSITFFGWEEDG